MKLLRSFRSATRSVAVAGLAAMASLAAWAGPQQSAPARQAAPPAPAPKAQLAGETFKNVQVLKDMPVTEFMESMGFFCASLGKSCEYCHAVTTGTWSDYAADNPQKQMTRKMIQMVQSINRDNFNGRRMVTCYSCHNGGTAPKVTPSLAAIYSDPLPVDPTDMPLGTAPAGVTADAVIDKYFQALGGAERLAAVTSFAATGTSQGYGPEAYDRQLEIYAKAPAELSTVIHTLSGDNTTTYDGRNGWVAAPDTLSPVPVVTLTGSDLDGAKVDAELAFPARLKQDFTGLRAGSVAKIEGRDVQIVQGRTAGGLPARFFFDRQSGLLVRLVRYTQSSLGLIPTQVDYSDYRDVAGIKRPFKWTVTWLDGQSTFALNEIQLNVPVDAGRFAKPRPPVAPPKPEN